MARGFHIGTVMSQGFQDLSKTGVGFLRAVHRGGVDPVVVDSFYLVTIRSVLVMDGLDRAYHNGRIRQGWVPNVGWVSSVFWVLFVVRVSREVWVQFWHGFKVWDPGKICVLNFSPSQL